MSTFKRYIKNINKQYGKNIKAFENTIEELPECKMIEDLFEKHGLDLSNRQPMMSIIHKRWGFASKDNNTINSYEDIERIANEN